VSTAPVNFPKITVVVVNFNQGIYIGKCLDSIIASGYSLIDLLIIDDCSTDNSAEIINSYISHNRVKCRFEVNETNRGICYSLNKALSLAEGEYFTFIAADDWGDTHRFHSMVQVFQRMDSKCAVVYSDARIVDMDEAPLYPSYLGVYRPDLPAAPEGNVFLPLLKDNFLPAMATLTRTKALKDVQGFDESLKVEDYDLWLRLARQYSFAFDPDSFCYYRILPNSLIRRIGARKYEDWIRIYWKHWGFSDEADQLLADKVRKCCEFLYYTDSGRFSELYALMCTRLRPTTKLRTLYLFNRLGVKGSQLKKGIDRLMGRSKSILRN
jgi:glycosyltransferase involved in cell wall biosynthesis